MIKKFIIIIIIIMILMKIFKLCINKLSEIEFKIYKKKKIKIDKKGPAPKINILFGIPGSGKSTHLTYLAKKFNKSGVTVYSNSLDLNYDILENVKYLPYSYVGKVDVDNSVLLLDEMGIELDNREYKVNFKDREVLKWYKLFRHHNCAIYIYSQQVDIDKKVRDLSESYYLVRRSILPYCTCLVPIVKKIGIDENSKQIIDAFEFPKFLDRLFNKKKRKKIIFQPFNWKYFNSWGCDKLPSIADYEKETKQMLSKLPFRKKVQTG